MKTTKTGFSAMALAFALAAPLTAQLPSASTPALGMGDNFTAAARGYHAIVWNPALLGVGGNPSASLALAPIRIVAGLDPVSLSDFKQYEGKVVEASVKAKWLADVTAEGREQGSGGFDATALAVQIGRFAFQASTRANAVADLGPGAVRLLLYGNTDEQGNPQAFNLEGSNFNAFWTSTLAGSFGLPIKLSNGTASVGATLKYTVGHMLAQGQDAGSQFTTQPNVTLRFATVSSASEDNDGINNGGGIGLDIGFAFQRDKLTLSAAVQNVFNSFEWKTDKFRFYPGEAIFNATTKEANFEDLDYGQAPAALRSTIDELKYKPSIAVGAALMSSDKLTLAADIRSRLGDGGIEEGPKFHAGAGVEYKLLSFLPVRAGAAAITGGFQFGGGIGLDLGPFNLGASLMQRDGELGKDTITMLTLISTGR